jgi:MFS family permease
LINYSATFAIVFMLSLYLQYLKKMTPREAGMIILAQPVVMALVSPLAGFLADKINPNKVSSFGMAISALGLFFFTFFNEHTSIAFIIGNLVLVGIGFGLFSSPNTTAVMASVERRYYGVASSMLGTMRLVGQMLSVGIAMMVIAIFVGKVKIQPDNYPSFLQSMKVSFIIFTALSVLGIFAALARNRHGAKVENQETGVKS